MKTKQIKEEIEKSLDEDSAVEPKTRGRKKTNDATSEEVKAKPTQDEAKSSKDVKKPVGRPKVLVKKRPLGIRKALRSKKSKVVANEKSKNVVKQKLKRGRKPAIKTETEIKPENENISMIPASEIKKEPIEDSTPNSRSSSPRTAGRRQRLSSDLAIMKSVLTDPPSNLVISPRTSPYSMRSERSNSPSQQDGKSLRSGKPRKVKSNLLNEVVMKEQKKRRRLLSDSKSSEQSELPESADNFKKLKRGRSCSRDGSEISKCSDVTESDISLSESAIDIVCKDLKKLDKPKTDLDIEIENYVQTTSTKVPSENDDFKSSLNKSDSDSIVNSKNNKNMSLKRSTSLDSDNNNSNRLTFEDRIEKYKKDFMKTEENNTLKNDRSSILTSMSKSFNSKQVSKNIRKARRGKKVAAAARPNTNEVAKNGISSTITNDQSDDKNESLESLSKEINDLINNLDQNIDDGDNLPPINQKDENLSISLLNKSKLNVLHKPLCDNNAIVLPETPVKDILTSVTNDNTPSKTDDSENIRLHYEEDSTESSKQEITYKVNTVASIDKLMDRLKEFEEFDKRRQRLETETKNDSKSVMVTNDVVLIPKSGDIKPLKDIQSVRPPERSIEKENVLSCFENNSAISIVKRDQVRKSVDIDLPNSITLIKRNSISARKESTSSNHSRESDAISIFEKSLGKDVTLTEIRKSVDKPQAQVDLNQYATLQSANSKQVVVDVGLDPNEISITPQVAKIGAEVDIIKRKSIDSLSRKSSESVFDSDEKMATLERIKSPQHQILAATVIQSPTPVAIKSHHTAMPLEADTLGPPLENVKDIADDVPMTSEASLSNKTPTGSETAKVKDSKLTVEHNNKNIISVSSKTENAVKELLSNNEKLEFEEHDLQSNKDTSDKIEDIKDVCMPEKVETHAETSNFPSENSLNLTESMPTVLQSSLDKIETNLDLSIESLTEKIEIAKSVSRKSSKSDRISTESQPGPSNALNESPESQKRKENVLRTLGLLTHKAAKEAKIEKEKEKERIYGASFSGAMTNKNKGKGVSDYTGTLKTVIKLNRGVGDRERKKYRSSLKMTFQKSKNRTGKPALDVGDVTNEDDAYYTIERREGVPGSTDGGHRKSHYSNRLNNHEGESAPEPIEPKETLNLVIPEKASSFSIHPGRLCMDQCFYCGGKFGLFDTPCHIAQMKSSDRQKKVLDNEEKLTIDSCLCDACYRHVDRRANCPSYRKRGPPRVAIASFDSSSLAPSASATADNQTSPEKSLSLSPPLEDESSDESGSGGGSSSSRPAVCHAEGCGAPADRAIRRKWLIKMRSNVSKVLRLRGDYPGLHTIPLCAPHHGALGALLACALCRRREPRLAHLHHAHHSVEVLNPLLQAEGIPVQFTERPVLCKMCRRYYCSLLQRPDHDDKLIKAYKRRLLKIYNIEFPPESDEGDDINIIQEEEALISGKQKKKKTKSKQRKSIEPDKASETDSNETTHPEIDSRSDLNSIHKTGQHLEEDIESLISSNKIPVPGAKTSESGNQSDGSDTEMIMELDPAMLGIDRQTELQYLLQRQNNPAQFLQKSNSTQGHKKLMKIQNINSIHKPGQQHRLGDKSSKKLQKLGHVIVKDKNINKDSGLEIFDPEKSKETSILLKNISLNEECTIETIPNRKSSDITTTLKNKWQMSESFTQVQKNLSELSKKLTIEPKKVSDGKYSNPVKRLETNPSISVRELFPGEEEMNLQCNIDFNNVKGVTPEGWEKCNTVIQYDTETKRLWNDLQRPYGNQSSFLRHLILLEKYFRNGDLVLSHNATSNAVNYSDSVQHRLRAFDNVSNVEPSFTAPKISSSLIEFRKKPSINNKSLLKTNQSTAVTVTMNSEINKDQSSCMPPPNLAPKNKTKSDKPKKAVPPELIAINTPNSQGRKSIQSVLHNIQQLVKGVSASDPIEVASGPIPAQSPTSTPTQSKPTDPIKEKKDSQKTEMAKSDAPKKTKTTSKPWRPTLMPITKENLAKIVREPTQVAVDGRQLRSLVQVTSSGERYHITLQDYNKMCILRREKLQQIQDGETKTKKTGETETVVTEMQPLTMLGNGGTLLQNITVEKQEKTKDVTELTTDAATILKNVGLKNITIAPIPQKTATITSQTVSSPIVTTPSIFVNSTPLKFPQLGSSVSITSETVLTSTLPVNTSVTMPKIPKSLTVIPQTLVSSPVQNLVVTNASVLPSQAVIQPIELPRP